MKAVVLTTILWKLSSVIAGQLPPPEAWVQADIATIRLDPSQFANLPRPVTAELHRRGCTVPQVYADKRPHNVIRGSFTTRAQVDWAVLCSRRRTSSILIFWGGNPTTISELESKPDAGFLQVVNPGQIGFSRAIGVASPKYIREHHEQYGGPKPPPLTHDGINDMFVGKASVVWYWHRGKWLQLQGAD